MSKSAREIPHRAGRAGRMGGRALVAALLCSTLAAGAAAVASTDLDTTGWELRARQAAEALPPLPPTSQFPVQLVLDDDQPDGDFGVGNPAARQFLWFNRFARPAGTDTLLLEEIWVLFSPGPNMAVGNAVELVVWVDGDGDPTTGADLVATYDETIQVLDGATFSVYPLAAPLEISQPGDVLIGVVPRFIQSGVTPTTFPAAIDTTASQGRSWLALWTTDPPDPPALPPDDTLAPIDGFIPGNWMIRAFGSGRPASVFDVPTLSFAGVLALIALLAAGALFLLRRRAAGAALLAGLALLAAPAAEAQVLIDDFSQSQAELELSVPPDAVGDTASSNQGGGGMVGGQRDLLLRFLEGGGGGEGMATSVGDDLFSFIADPGARGESTITWDGDTDPGTLDPTGLGNVDLTGGGTQTGLRLLVFAADAGVEVFIEVFTDGANSSTAGLVLPAVAAPTPFVLAFADFRPEKGTGADFADVGAITLLVRGDGVSVDLDQVETAAPLISAAKVDTLSVDADGDGMADPGDRVRYRVTIDNAGSRAAALELLDALDPAGNTTLVGAVRTTPLAFNDSYETVGNVSLVVDVPSGLPSLLANDGDPDGDAVTVDTAGSDTTTAQGGTVSYDDALGHFTYDPPAGFRGVDQFTYRLAAVAGDPVVPPVAGRAVVHVKGLVWFVDNTNDGCGSPPCGDGSQADPFQTMKQAEVASAPDDIIRVREGDGTDTGHSLGFILKPGQRLVGGAADLMINGNLVEAGTGYSVHSHAAGNVLDLAGDHVIEGMILNPTTGHGVAGTGTSNLTLDDVILNPGGSAGGILLVNHSGAFTFSNSAITAANATTGRAVEVSGGSGTFDFSGSSIAHNGGGLIRVTGAGAGSTFDFTGSNPTLAAGSDDAIFLMNNAGASFTFDAIGALTTGAGNGIFASNGGTVNLDTIGAVSATGGAALDISGTTVAKIGGVGPVTVASLSSSGGAIGVHLDGVAPAVTVSGATSVNGAAGVNLEASGAVSFAGQLAVTSTAGGGLRAHNNGQVTATTASNSLSATGGPALDVLSTGLDLTFASVAANHGAGRGVSLMTTPGTTRLGAVTLTTTNGEGLFADGAGTVTSTGGTIASTNRAAVDINNTTTATTFTSLTSNSSTARGVELTNLLANSSFTVTGTTAVDNAAAGDLFTEGAIHIDTVAAGSAIGFGTTNITNRNGTGIHVDQMNGTSLAFGATTIPNPGGAATGAGGYGIRVEDSAAAVTFASATISDTRETVAQTNSPTAPTVPTNDGDGDAIFLKDNGAAGASFTLNGGTLSNLDVDGFDIRRCRDVSINGVTVDGSDYRGILGVDLAGNLNLSGVTLTNISNATRGEALRLFQTTTSPDVSIVVDDTQFTHLARTGILIETFGNATTGLTVTGDPFNLTTGVGATSRFDDVADATINMLAQGGNNDDENWDVLIENTFFNDVFEGPSLISGGDQAADIRIRDNKFNSIGRPGPQGDDVIDILGRKNSDLNVAITGNRVDDVQVGSGFVVAAIESSVLTAFVDGNTLDSIDKIGIRVETSDDIGELTGGRDAHDVVVTNNTLSRFGQQSGGASFFRDGVEIDVGQNDTPCIDIEDNSFSMPGSGSFDVHLDVIATGLAAGTTHRIEQLSGTFVDGDEALVEAAVDGLQTATSTAGTDVRADIRPTTQMVGVADNTCDHDPFN